MKHTILLFFILIFNSPFSGLLGQDTFNISGVITSTSGQSISNATIIVHKKADSLALYFSRSNSSGAYEITCPTNNLPVLLSVSCLGYERQFIEVKTVDANKRSTANFTLHNKIQILDEVIVRNIPKIQVSGDTTSYKLSAFTLGNERVLEEALSRLPGFSINENGRISVNGRPIQKILVEGDDIVNQNYTLLSKNLSPEIISQVQVLNKYLDDPLLKGIEKTDDVAVNLTFKNKNEKIFIGDASLEGGFKKKYRANINEIILTKRNKAYALLSGNNIGSAPQLISNTQPIKKTTLAKDYDPLKENKEFVSLYPGRAPLVDGSRNFFNNSKTASLNLLTKFNKKLETKINLTIESDSNRLAVDRRTSYFSGDDTISYIEQTNWRSKPFRIEGAFNVNYNFSSRSRLRYNLSLSEGEKKEGAFILFNTDSLPTNLSTKFSSLKHNLNYTFKVSNDKALVIDVARYVSKAPQSYDVSGYDYSLLFSRPADFLYQNSNHSVNYWGGQARYYTTWKRATVIYTTGYDRYSQKIVSDISGRGFISAYNNNVSIINDDLFLTADFSNKYLNGKIETIARLGVHHMSLQKQYLSNQAPVVKISDQFVNPDINLRYYLNNKNRFTLGYSYNMAYPEATYLYDSLIFSKYRNAARYNNRFSMQNEQRVSLGYRYSDSYNMISAFVNGFYSITRNNYVDSTFIQPLLNTAVRYQMPVNYKTLGILGGGEKFIPALSGSLKLSVNALNNRFENNLNTIDRLVSSWNLGSKFSYITAFGGFVNFVSSFQYVKNSNRVRSNKIDFKTYNIATNTAIKADCKFAKHYFLQVTGYRYQWTSEASSQEPVYFLDASLLGNIIKDKLSLTATIQNIFNVQKLNFNQVSDYMVSSIAYDLVPRFFIVGVRVRF